MNGLKLFLAANLMFFMQAGRLVSETIPCISPEVFSLEDKFKIRFTPGFIYQNLFGDIEKELVLVNEKDERWVLEIFTSNSSVQLCRPDISLNLELDVGGSLLNSESVSDLREYGFHLGLNERGSIVFEEFWYGGSRGFELSGGTYILRLLDNKTLEWIGFEDKEVGLNYDIETRSLNFITGRYLVSTSPGVMQSEGKTEERWGTFPSGTLTLSDGDTFGKTQREVVSSIFTRY